MKIDVISDKSEKPQIESEEDQPLMLMQPPTLLCTFDTPYKGVEVKEHSQIFYITATFVLDDPDATDSFVLEVPNELLNLKEGVHASLPNTPFVVDISKGEGITRSITSEGKQVGIMDSWHIISRSEGKQVGIMDSWHIISRTYVDLGAVAVIGRGGDNGVGVGVEVGIGSQTPID
ncbi:hypothetical protein Syun_014913 [Stephania yunnanensis]|uniref:Uncharacterized protein n=1 Tax=Stephania yunnanensis TaxID=152371 RepID=A0AAP0JK79_9MAGN